MPLFKELLDASSNSDNLEFFVVNNIDRFHELYNGHYTHLYLERNDIRDFIELKGSLLEDLDYSISQCKAFISILFDFSERFGFLSTIRIENTLAKRDLNLGKRREAAKLYLLNIRNNQDYIDRFEQICTLIQCSIETEEDTDLKPIVTFSNFVAKIIRDTSEHFISAVRSKILYHSENNTFPFLQNPLIQQINSISIDDIDSVNAQIQSLIEAFLGHTIDFVPDREDYAEDLLIENDSPYFDQLTGNPISFETVRGIAVDNCHYISSTLPGRGVTPLNSENEMYIYLKRYGNMHQSKLVDAFEAFPFDTLNKTVDIIDWGCGQGLASLVLIDYLREHQINLDVHKIILIEPSELSIKRAALHVSLAKNEVLIKTVKNVFNSLLPDDVETSSSNIKLHLFSNVLDIDESFFSQSNLIRLIEETQSGINYMFCISPYITDEKADRVNSFKRHFENRYVAYDSIYEASNSGRLEDEYWNCNNNFRGNMNVYCQHPECGCEHKWTRVVNVFSLDL